MKKVLVMWLALAFCLAAVPTADVALAQEVGEGNAYGLCRTWNFAADYAAGTDDSQPVYGDACGRAVWHLYDSGSLGYDPAAYTPLNSFIASGYACTPGTGLKGWATGGYVPLIAVNLSGVDQICDPWAPITWLAAAVNVHPSPGSAAVVGWKSPVGGHVSVSVNFTDIDLWGGDGVNWFVQKNGVTLASGVTIDGDSASWKSDKLKIEDGDFLYFGVGPGSNGDYYYDSTRLEITIEH